MCVCVCNYNNGCVGLDGWGGNVQASLPVYSVLVLFIDCDDSVVDIVQSHEFVSVHCTT